MHNVIYYIIEHPFRSLFYTACIWALLEIIYNWHKNKKEHQKTIDDINQARYSEIAKIEEAAEFLEFKEPKIADRELNLWQLARLMSFHKKSDCDDGIYEMLSEKAFIRMAYLQHEYDRSLITPLKFDNNEWTSLTFATSITNLEVHKILSPIFLKIQKTGEPVLKALTFSEYEKLKEHYKFSLDIMHNHKDSPLFKSIIEIAPHDPTLHESKSFIEIIQEQGQQMIEEIEIKIDILNTLTGHDSNH